MQRDPLHRGGPSDHIHGGPSNWGCQDGVLRVYPSNFKEAAEIALNAEYNLKPLGMVSSGVPRTQLIRLSLMHLSHAGE